MRASVLWALTTLTFACADRAGISTTTLTPAGGGLRSADGLFSIEIPEGALAEDAEVTITIRDDILATDLTSRIYEVSAVELVPNAVVTVRYRAPRTPWIGRRGMATFDEGRVELATDFDYDHLEHVASAVYESLDRRQFGLATTVETELPCSPGCLRMRRTRRFAAAFSAISLTNTSRRRPLNWSPGSKRSWTHPLSRVSPIMWAARTRGKPWFGWTP